VRQPDITLARQLLGWEPRVELHEGLAKTLDASGTDVLMGSGSA
jgi:dTDP-glucose 4,6-dehydratase